MAQFDEDSAMSSQVAEEATACSADVAADASAVAAAQEGSVMDAESSSAAAEDDGPSSESDAQPAADAVASDAPAADETEAVPSEDIAERVDRDVGAANASPGEGSAEEQPADANEESLSGVASLAAEKTNDDFQTNAVDRQVVDVEHAIKVRSIGTGLMTSTSIDWEAESFADAHSQSGSQGRLQAGGSARGYHGDTVSLDGRSPIKGGKWQPALQETMDISSDEELGSGLESSYETKPVEATGCTTKYNRRVIAGLVSVALVVLVGLGIGLSNKSNDEATRMAISKAVLMALSRTPSMSPSEHPSVVASDVPSGAPTNVHSFVPSGAPSYPPSPAPSDAPTLSPSFLPSTSPSSSPMGLPSASPTVSIAPTKPFLLGDLAIARRDLGIKMSTGLKARLVATTGRKITFANGKQSARNFHTYMDGAGIVKLSSGYVYVSNSEDDRGGVYGLYFNDAGKVIDYKTLLSGTTWNCGGGLSPWGTWVSCEEHSRGQCWQVDPDPAGQYHATPRKTLLGGDGGKYESVACDNSNPARPVFFSTEDDDFGALRRFEADHGNGWDALHSGGRTTFLRIFNGHQFEWTTNKAAARTSANIYYRNAEGISYHDGFVYFTAKVTKTLLILDLKNLTYKAETTGGRYEGQGNFNAQPDQILLETHKRWIYFTEDGGNPGVYVRDRHTGTYTALFESDGTYRGDETVGVALSPDRKRFYAGYQDAGKLIEFTREDGLPFE